MEILIYDRNFNLLSEFDNFNSLIWCERFKEAGAIDLVIECNEKNINLFSYGNFIVRKDTKSVCRIDNVEIVTESDNTDQLIIGATDLKTVAKNAVVGSSLLSYGERGNAEELLRQTFALFCPDETSGYDETLFPDFKTRFFKMKNSHGFANEVYSLENDKTDLTAYDVMTEYCNQSGLGWSITFENGYLWFDVLENRNNTNVIFSPDFENIKETKWKKTGEKVATVARVLHKYKDILNDNGFILAYDTATIPTGLDCIEVVVDATNLNLDGLNAEDFREKLYGLGVEKLRQMQVKLTYDCEVFTNLYKYKENYNLGDYCKVKNKYGIEVEGQIVEVVETWDINGYSIEPKFEYNEIEDNFTAKALMTEDGFMLETENYRILLWEDIEYNCCIIGSKKSKKVLADKYGRIIGTKKEVMQNG